MSLKVTDSGPPIVQPSTCLKNLLLNCTFCSKFYQQSSKNQFRTNWRQLFMNVNLLNDCKMYSFSN